MFLDIREFYDAGGDDKPGKKGISLTAEQVMTITQLLAALSDTSRQWAVLKDNIEFIDVMLKTAKK